MASDDSDIDACLAAIIKAADEIVIEFVTEVVALLVEDTPFLTGFARANWIPNIGSAIAYVDGKPNTKGKSSSAGSAQQAGLASMLSYTLSQGDVFISNNVPYIRRLDAGYSDQAPAGYVQDCIDRAQLEVSTRALVE